MDVRQWQHAWVGTAITVGVAAAFAWLAALAIARKSAAPPPARKRR